jgi:hypothetical protein
VCIQYYIVYSCGCRQDADFDQCDKLLGTNKKCALRGIQDVPEKLVGNHCEAHLVEYDSWVKMRMDEIEDEDQNEDQEAEEKQEEKQEAED